MPMTTASMSRPRQLGVVEGALRRLAQQPGQRHVVADLRVVGLPDADDGAALGHQSLLQDAHEVLLQARARTWRGRACACRPFSLICRNASPMRTSPVTMSGLATSAPPDGLTSTSSPRPSASRRSELLVAEGAPTARRPRPARRRRRPPRRRAGSTRDVGEVAHARVVRIDAVVDAADPGRALADLAGPVAGDEDHRGGAVGDRRAVAGRAAARRRTARPAGRRR